MRNLSYWNPWISLGQLQRRINRLIDDNLTQENTPQALAQADWTPRVDAYETADALVLEMDLPGVLREHIQIEFKDRLLAIKGVRQPQGSCDRGQSAFPCEREFGTFQRVFTLAVPVDETKIRARCRDGVLTLIIPKADARRPATVPISD